MDIGYSKHLDIVHTLQVQGQALYNYQYKKILFTEIIHISPGMGTSVET